MLGLVKRMLIVALVVCPLTFFGQGWGGSYKTKSGTYGMSAYGNSVSTSSPYFSGGIGPSFLNADNPNPVMGYGARFGIGYDLQSAVSIQGNIGFSKFSGEYNYTPTTNFELLNLDCLELDVNLSLNIVNLFFGYNADRRIQVSPHIGVGQVQYRSHMRWYDGREITKGYGRQLPYGDGEYAVNEKGNGVHGRMVALTIPCGLDINYSVTKELRVHLDVITTFVDSDAFDAIETFGSKDWYSGVRIGVTYKWKRRASSTNFGNKIIGSGNMFKSGGRRGSPCAIRYNG